MRSLRIALILGLIGGAALAADPPQQTDPFVIIAPKPTQRIDVEIGAAEINTHAARIRIAYLPRMAPLPGTLPHSIATMPNAFELLNVSLPQRFSPSSVAGRSEPNVTIARNAATTREPLRLTPKPSAPSTRAYSAK
jgi:hypothetical protein